MTTERSELSRSDDNQSASRESVDVAVAEPFEREGSSSLNRLDQYPIVSNAFSPMNIGGTSDEDWQVELSPIPLPEKGDANHLSAAQNDLLSPLFEADSRTEELTVDFDPDQLSNNRDLEGEEGTSSVADDRENDDCSKSSGGRPGLNDSITSKGSLREEEIIRTKEEIDATSQAFLQRLQGAAFRRKADLAKSSGNLAAKERMQREALASLRRFSEPIPSSLEKASKPNLVNKHFRARPLPSTTGARGAGGLAGVPKVRKKPTTTPFSPLLGARRQSQSNNLSTWDSHTRGSVPERPTVFRALQLPRTNSFRGHAGQSGVPKVEKRPTTVPFSPLLGLRRPKSKSRAPPPVDSSFQSIDHNGSKSNKTSQSGSSLGLLGLSFVTRPSTENQEPQVPVEISSHVGYQPHSSARAAERAGFESRRVANARFRKEEESNGRKELVKTLKKELRILRKSL